MNARSDGRPKLTYRAYPYGVHRRRDRRKQWIVKFKRNKKCISVGAFYTLPEASAAAYEFVTKEAKCPSPTL
jgi:hypothetical protein